MNIEKTIKVFGHQSPDTDASCSAIVWAWFLNNHRKQQAEAYILGPVNTEARFVIDRFNIDMPEILTSVNKDDVVAIVDTNNLDELFENINETTITSIIDHHKLVGNLKTSSPLELVIQPYASTMTVIHQVMNLPIHELPKEIAGLILSGIISDTLAFRSPTTTSTDKQLAESLAESLNINISEYASEMFEAKSNISDFSAAELIRMDSKIYEIKGKQTRVSVLETTNPEIVLSRYDEIIAAIPTVIQEDNLEQVLLFTIDILKEEATVFTYTSNIKELISDSFNTSVTGNTVTLPGIVSRKKQILPKISK